MYFFFNVVNRLKALKITQLQEFRAFAHLKTARKRKENHGRIHVEVLFEVKDSSAVTRYASIVLLVTVTTSFDSI